MHLVCDLLQRGRPISQSACFVSFSREDLTEIKKERNRQLLYIFTAVPEAETSNIPWRTTS